MHLYIYFTETIISIYFQEHCPKFLVLVDHETASVVLVIRGTFSFKADMLAVFENDVVVPIDPPNCEDFGR